MPLTNLYYFILLAREQTWCEQHIEKGDESLRCLMSHTVDVMPVNSKLSTVDKNEDEDVRSVGWSAESVLFLQIICYQRVTCGINNYVLDRRQKLSESNGHEDLEDGINSLCRHHLLIIIIDPIVSVRSTTMEQFESQMRRELWKWKRATHKKQLVSN